jgi:uncharacterized membrane protein
MRYLVGFIVAVPVLLLALGALTGRVKAQSCCVPVDPNHDRRLWTIEDTEGAGSATSMDPGGH